MIVDKNRCLYKRKVIVYSFWNLCLKPLMFSFEYYCYFWKIKNGSQSNICVLKHFLFFCWTRNLVSIHLENLCWHFQYLGINNLDLMKKYKGLKVATSSYLSFACSSWLLQIQRSLPASDILNQSVSKYHFTSFRFILVLFNILLLPSIEGLDPITDSMLADSYCCSGETVEISGKEDQRLEKSPFNDSYGICRYWSPLGIQVCFFPPSLPPQQQSPDWLQPLVYAM